LNSKFIVIPSECYENNPRSVIEAFALGKPAIGARIGGIPELVRNHETGLTFESGNVEDLREKISDLLNNPDKIVDMGKNARAFVERELNAEKHYQRLMEIYKQAK
ncbi:glycosyltransferase, partial [Acidobacteriota bacterium]